MIHRITWSTRHLLSALQSAERWSCCWHSNRGKWETRTRFPPPAANGKKSLVSGESIGELLYVYSWQTHAYMICQRENQCSNDGRKSAFGVCHVFSLRAILVLPWQQIKIRMSDSVFAIFQLIKKSAGWPQEETILSKTALMCFKLISNKLKLCAHFLPWLCVRISHRFHLNKCYETAERTSYILYLMMSLVAITSFITFSRSLWNNLSNPGLEWLSLDKDWMAWGTKKHFQHHNCGFIKNIMQDISVLQSSPVWPQPSSLLRCTESPLGGCRGCWGFQWQRRGAPVFCQSEERRQS